MPRRGRRRRGGSGLQARRRARAAFFAAARMVQAELNLDAVAQAGQARLLGRAIACHIAAEAFDVRPYLVAIAAGVDRRSASAAQYRLWDRRDADAALEARIAMIIHFLRVLAGDDRLARDVMRAVKEAA
jgi:hypothetical protein